MVFPQNPLESVETGAITWTVGDSRAEFVRRDTEEWNQKRGIVARGAAGPTVGPAFYHSTWGKKQAG